MGKAKNQKRRGPRKAPGKRTNLMERSDIPYAQRMALKHQNDIVVNRNHAAKIAMYCNSIAMNELEGIGFVIDDDEVLAFSDDDGNAITPRQWLEQRTKEEALKC